MSTPRQIVQGSTWHITRRTAERRFFLQPSAHVTQVFLYCLGYAAAECGVLVHAFEVLSNHFHLVATDPGGRLPEFMERLDGLLARALNAYRGRWESFFAPGSYGAVRLETPVDILSKMAYVLTNAVAAGLVSHSHRWTGASSCRWGFGETRTFSRPKGGFFDPDGSMPSNVALTLASPPGFDDRSAEELDELLRERVIARETEIRESFRNEGRSFQGMDEVMRCDPNDRPGTPEPRRTTNPQVAGGDTEGRIGAIERLQEFRTEYRAAWLRWRAGDRQVVFPMGTYLMRVRHGAVCRPPPPS